MDEIAVKEEIEKSEEYQKNASLQESLKIADEIFDGKLREFLLKLILAATKGKVKNVQDVPKVAQTTKIVDQISFHAPHVKKRMYKKLEKIMRKEGFK